jgi:hypothetical protein
VKEEDTEQRRIFQDNRIHKWYVQPNIIRDKIWRMREAGPKAHVEEMINAYNIFVRRIGDVFGYLGVL